MLMKILFAMSFMSMCWWRKIVILMLLSMEMMLTILFLSITSSNFLSSYFNSMFMLVMMVIGSSMGISMMVTLSRLQNSCNSQLIWSLT
uniref:NADH dehydrogenase subunit 4L n=1 Tax=Tetragnatha maxillosa TaxID=216284 RepID=A0A0A0YNJ1_9ARAC|nr:NADH dehydrogenase subunit 4L [Tetragnatha maxillosa]AIX11773.1 NADH dehydrogenase subunit 4L [Tetragnatha maxillosa]